MIGKAAAQIIVEMALRQPGKKITRQSCEAIRCCELANS